MQKKDIQVLIGGKVYTLSGEESEEYMQRVALYINNKLSELRTADSAKKLNTHMMGILLALNVADDYFKAKTQLDNIEVHLEEKDQQIASLEQDVISEQVKLENAQIQIDKLKDELIRMEKEVLRCQNELDEYINTFSEE